MTKRNVRVAIDASSAASGGGLTYLREIAPRLLEQPGVTIEKILLREEVELSTVPPDKLVRGTGRVAALSRRWSAAIRSCNPQVVYVPTEISVTGYRVPLVLGLNQSLYDSRLTREHVRYQRLRLRVQRRFVKSEARRVAGFIAISDYAASIGVDVIRIPRSKIHRIYHGGPPRKAPVPSPRPVRRFLCVSDFYRHKNLERAIDALAGLKGDWNAELIGAPVDRAYFDRVRAKIDDQGLSDRITIAGPGSQAEVASAYRRADCLLWPSYAETFGHPLVEAHSFGLPIVAAAAASNVEIAGEAATYFDPFDGGDMRRVLQAAVDHGVAVGDLPRVYDWDACAEETAAYLRRMARSGP